MDEIDHIQEAASAAQEAMLAERRRLADAEARTKPPAARACDGCDCDIPAARLKLRPLTRFCVDCQADFEAGRL